MKKIKTSRVAMVGSMFASFHKCRICGHKLKKSEFSICTKCGKSK